tara:strand:- start:261 stop:386 length:126 start_codon:yes stop_codon:yes gene_type:complete
MRRSGMHYKKEEKIGCIFMINTSEFSKIKFFEETDVDFVKY